MVTRSGQNSPQVPNVAEACRRWNELLVATEAALVRAVAAGLLKPDLHQPLFAS